MEEETDELRMENGIKIFGRYAKRFTKMGPGSIKIIFNVLNLWNLIF